MLATEPYRIDPSTIGGMTLSELEPYKNAYEMKRTLIDRDQFLMGRYVQQAIMSTVLNTGWFRNKSDTPYEYPELPYMTDEKTIEEYKKAKMERELQAFINREEGRRKNWEIENG